ncbi:hypothetical protein H1Z61_16790 [Bacillus aquiflavi]|uniref:WXG100 family type VII secretion target n=1 Tax=Bacillus aquiflavi TaxID=2672567 RepID=A0A6B3W597_9BACI|nr:hypothetical protein [Bacillus aquiflavi]MBA4538737.1 hypothetical protein [Bacillus aquiflavi]NEY83096.1 hypothetical protein [Bacillus aquiflavi]UAC48384.1 hypothetical protein K6959_18125 [Bacillus aquiflavi]
MGSTQEIKLHLEELQTTLNQLQTGMNEFTSYTTTFRSNTRDRLKNFHSDFIAKVDVLLDNMNNDVNQDLIKQLQEIYQAGKTLLESMKQVDEELGEAIGGDRS